MQIIVTPPPYSRWVDTPSRPGAGPIDSTVVPFEVTDGQVLAGGRDACVAFPMA